MDSAAMAVAVSELAARILSAPSASSSPLVLIGIHNRGVPLAQRLAVAMERLQGTSFPVGTLDITQHRDDLAMLTQLPSLIGSDIPFDIDDARVVLCDEVIYTGRSIRAALGELLDFGRPARVELAVLVDRSGRDFPIQPDFAALRVHIDPSERIRVFFREVDDCDQVVIETTHSSPS